MSQPGNAGGCTSGSYGWKVDPAGVKGICLVVESIGWDLAAPHGRVRASGDVAASVFDGDEEQVVAEELRKTWNRVVGRNMVYAEATIQHILSSITEATNFVQDGNCQMAQQTLDGTANRPEGRVFDGLHP